MPKRAMFCAGLAAALAAPVVAQEAAAWSRLRAGMTREEAAAVLGRPLLRNTGKGFETWFYSGGAEVLFYRGPVYAWTAPAPMALAAPPATAKYSHDVFFLPGRSMPAQDQRAPAKPAEESEGYNLQEILRYRAR